MTATRIHLTEAVARGIAARAQAAMPNETGGALIGWREGEFVNVMDSIEIPSVRPDHARYQLSVADLNEALERYISSARDARMGYVGSWHSHPAMVGPSPRDRYTFWRTGRAHTGAMAFVVAATDGRTTVLHTTWAGRRDGHYRLQRQEPTTRTGG